MLILVNNSKRPSAFLSASVQSSEDTYAVIFKCDS